MRFLSMTLGVMTAIGGFVDIGNLVTSGITGARDRQIFDVDGLPVGKVDDLELTESEDGGPPVLTAILTGPLALGLRIGGRIGKWWAAAGQRLRPRDDPRPNRIPITQVDHCDRTELKLSVSRASLDADRLRVWTRDHIIEPIPGSGHSSGAA